MRKHIRILNPLTGAGYVSRQRAKRYIAAGVAAWAVVGVSIRFLRDQPVTISVRRAIDATAQGYAVASHRGMATLRELANTPMTCPGVALGIGRRKGASRQTFLASQGF